MLGLIEAAAVSWVVVSLLAVLWSGGQLLIKVLWVEVWAYLYPEAALALRERFEDEVDVHSRLLATCRAWLLAINVPRIARAEAKAQRNPKTRTVAPQEPVWLHVRVVPQAVALAVDTPPVWAVRRDADAQRILQYMVRQREAGQMRGWSFGGLFQELHGARLFRGGRDRVHAAVSRLHDQGLLDVEGDRIDNTRFGPSERALHGNCDGHGARWH